MALVNHTIRLVDSHVITMPTLCEPPRCQLIVLITTTVAVPSHVDIKLRNHCSIRLPQARHQICARLPLVSSGEAPKPLIAARVGIFCRVPYRTFPTCGLAPPTLRECTSKGVLASTCCICSFEKMECNPPITKILVELLQLLTNWCVVLMRISSGVSARCSPRLPRTQTHGAATRSIAFVRLLHVQWRPAPVVVHHVCFKKVHCT